MPGPNAATAEPVWSLFSPDTSDTTTVILGSGIIGLSTAYCLSGTGNTDPALGRLSYKLHAQLAQAHNGRTSWGYAHSTGISLSQDSEEDAVGGSGEDWLESGTSKAQLASYTRPWEEEDLDAEWLPCRKDATMAVISRYGTTAQIGPLRFWRLLLARCKERGIQVRFPARALSVSRDASGVLNGIRISQDGMETELPFTRLAITSSAWSPRVFTTLFPAATTRIPISALGAHSLLVRNPHFKPDRGDEEFFARTGGEFTTTRLPDVATEAITIEKAIDQLKACAKIMMMGVLGKDFEVLREGLCFRPVTSSGCPIVSKIPDEKLGRVTT
ncbi:hypothetical protein BDU57DRAFT_584265 [Ampelomyces quisqualis]|uniref:FAD dependent oxidoreductase domain-containing protein n=1 Tax=Ampelomyces quisqualis TaxID=50730 RepID=A0A6A5QZ37_AMPQU|nr:hypothetical protein BDU57DRAFT_584265 [Ampelomyces quisqualis]